MFGDLDWRLRLAGGFIMIVGAAMAGKVGFDLRNGRPDSDPPDPAHFAQSPGPSGETDAEPDPNPSPESPESFGGIF